MRDVNPTFLFPSVTHASPKLVTSSWSPLIIWLCFKGHCFYFFFICDLSFFSDGKPWCIFSCVTPPWFRLPYPLLIAFFDFTLFQCLCLQSVTLIMLISVYHWSFLWTWPRVVGETWERKGQKADIRNRYTPVWVYGCTDPHDQDRLRTLKLVRFAHRTYEDTVF